MLSCILVSPPPSFRLRGIATKVLLFTALQAVVGIPVMSAQNLFPSMRIAAGGTGFRDLQGLYWFPDAGFSGGTPVYWSKGISGAVNQGLYRYARVGMSSYEFRMAPGSYAVTLKFADCVNSAPGQRVFSVTANGAPFLNDFDVIEAAGGSCTAVERTTQLNAADGRIRLGFQGRTGEPIVSAIQVLRIEDYQPPEVRLEPSQIVIKPGFGFRFTPKVSNTEVTTVLYTIEPEIGSVTSTGIYRAPSTSITETTTVTLTARSAADPSRFSQARIRLVPTNSSESVGATQASVLTSPWYVAAESNQDRQFTASFSGTSGVVWSLEPAVGTITSGGRYRSPNRIDRVTLVTVRATSVSNPSVSDTSVICLLPPVSVEVIPTATRIRAGDVVGFTPVVTGRDDAGVVWSILPEIGTIDHQGKYTAPNVISSRTNVTVRATSKADPFFSGTARVTLEPSSVESPTPSGTAPGISVTVSPSQVTLGAGHSQRFLAALSGTTDARVTWSLSLPVGSISADGTYVAPSAISAPLQLNVIATSVADPTRSATAIVNLEPSVVISVTPSSARLNPGQQQLFTAFVTGTSNPGVTWSISPGIGSITAGGLYSAPNTLTNPAVVTVSATSVSDPTKSASALLELIPDIQVSVTPDPVTLAPGASKQFVASVLNSQNTAVVWSISPVIGTITSSGLYTAPQNVSAPTTVIVKATSVADPTRFDTATVTLQPAVSISLSPTSTSLTAGGSQLFVASVTGTSNTGVNWSLSAPVGTISASGLYTAPSSLTGPTSVTVRAASQADPTKTATATVQLSPEILVTVSPNSASLPPGGTVQFSASVLNTSDSAVTWSISPAVGSISPSGLYTAPLNVTQPVTVQVKATSVADSSRSGTATITVQPGVTVSVSPASAAVSAGGTQQYLATVTGTTNTGVNWSLTPAVGTISPSGLYTAPASLATTTVVTVTATSQADPGKSASASLTVQPGVLISVSPSSVSMSAGSSLQFNASVQNTANTAVSWSVSPQVGAISNTGLYTAPSTMSEAITVSIIATSQADPTKSATAAVTIQGTVSVSVTPSSVSLSAGGSQQFAAQVTGSANTAVTWTMSPLVGTLSQTGLYTAPANISSATTVTVRATSQADPAKSATASVQLTPGVSISLSPQSSTIAPAGTQQFTASVTGTANTDVTWTRSPAVGTISSTGLYTAPATVTAPTTVTISATSQADPTKSATATATIQPGILVTVSPSSASVSPGASLQFAATVSNTTNSAVTWTLSSPVGMISPSGLYTAPASVTSSTTVTVRATSVADPTKSGSATVNISPAVSVTLTSTATQLQASQTATLTAQVTGTASTGVTWSLNPANFGTLSTSGNTAVYTAPATNAAQHTVEVIATSMADTTKLAKVVLTILPTVSLSVTPSVVTLSAAQSAQFTAFDNGVVTNEVTWSLEPPIGSIQATGHYQAPATITQNQTVLLKATSKKDTTKSATATVTLSSDPGLRYTLDAVDGLSRLTFNGVDYTWKIGYVVYEHWTPPGGSEGQMLPSTRVSASLINNGTSVLHKYRRDPAHEWDLQVDYSGAGTNTLVLNVTITNRAASDTLRPFLTPLSWQLPAAPETPPGHITWHWDLSNRLPGGYLAYGSEAVAWWHVPADTNLQSFTEYPASGQRHFKIEWQFAVRNGPAAFLETIRPGQTKRYTLTFRFGKSVHKKEVLAPEIFETYRASFPYLLSYQDRRPIARITVANPNTERKECTPQNPRCYMMHKNPLGDPAGFRQSVLKFADDVLNVFNRMVNRPQGIIIWDIEGQEFLHPFTYVGDPANLHHYAPEMDAVADEFITRFRNAGYKIGFALRPQRVKFGTTLPSTCITNVNPNLRDVFVKLNAPFPYRGYICNAANTWVQEGPFRPAAQTDPRSYEELLSIMVDKVSYARNRWGATLFYVDSNGWSLDGSRMTSKLWRDLAAQFPDTLFFPEHRTISAYGAASAYNGDQPLQIYETEPEPNLIWQGKPFTLTLADVNTPEDRTKFVNAVRRGDILLFDGWFMWKGVTDVDSIYSEAK